jgi:hypothetical protein
MMIDGVSRLSHAELTSAILRLARCEREATAALIVHLAEFDARRLYEPAGYPSLFKYCMAVLHLSEDAVYNRIEVARAVRRHPVLAEMLASGALSPTTARLVADHLTIDNQEQLLAGASFKSKQAVEELLAHVFPQPDVAARVRKIAGPPVPPQNDMASLLAPVAAAPTSSTYQTASAAPRPVVRPLAPERYEIRFTASREMREELREAQELLAHAIPSGDIAAIFGRALTLLVTDLKRRKCAATPQPRRSPGQLDTSRNVPAEVRRAVWSRDQGRCGFVASHGNRCDERRFLEFHHVVPHGAGGPATVENIAMRCRTHNGHEVDLFYGPGKRRTRRGAVQAGPGNQGDVLEGRSRSGTSGPPEHMRGGGLRAPAGPFSPSP